MDREKGGVKEPAEGERRGVTVVFVSRRGYKWMWDEQSVLESGEWMTITCLEGNIRAGAGAPGTTSQGIFVRRLIEQQEQQHASSRSLRKPRRSVWLDVREM